MNPQQFIKFLCSRRQPGNTLKMYLIKQLLNFNVRLASHFIPNTYTSTMNGLIITETESVLLELVTAEFNEITKREGKKQDRNFETLLKTSFKLMRYLSENDPYYNLWLGMFIRELSRFHELYAAMYMQGIVEQAVENPTYLQLVKPEFQRYCFDLKTCGGLILLQQSLVNVKSE